MIDKPVSPSCERNREPILAVLREHFADRHHVLEIGSGSGQHAVFFAAAMPWLTWQCSDRADYLPGIRAWLDEAALPNTPAAVELDVAGAWPVLLLPLPLAGEGWGEGTRKPMADEGDGNRGLRGGPIGARPHTPMVLPAGRPPFGHLAPRPAFARSAQAFIVARANGSQALLFTPQAGEGNTRFDAAFSANSLHIMGWPEVEAFFAGLGSALADDATLVVYGPFNYGGAYSSDSNREFDQWLRARDPRSAIRDFEAVDALARAIGLALVDDVAMPANNRCLVWRR